MAHSNRANSRRNPSLLTVSEAARYCGVSAATIRNYVASGQLEALRIGSAGHRRFDLNKLKAFVTGEEIHDGKGANKVAIYCRVSTPKQSKDRKKEKTGDSDLTRQRNRMLEECKKRYPDREVVEYIDTGSALNFDRKSFVSLYRDILSGSLSGAVILVENRDRLCRLAARIVEIACEYHDVQVVYTNQESKTDDEMLCADLISITTYFAAKMYGSRHAERNTKGLGPDTVIRGKELFDTGHSISEVLNTLTKEGHKLLNGDNLTEHQVRKYIQKPSKMLNAVVKKGVNSAEVYYRECIEETGNQLDRLPTASAYADYSEWCNRKGFSPVNKFKFAQVFKHVNIGKHRENNVHRKAYCGIRVKGKALHKTVRATRMAPESATDVFLRFYSTVKGRKLDGRTLLDLYKKHAAKHGGEILEKSVVYGLLRRMGAVVSLGRKGFDFNIGGAITPSLADPQTPIRQRKELCLN
jgi:excisionase family DNA binding protein